MNTQQAAAALQSYHHFEYLLLGDLRELLNEPESAPNREAILVILNRLLRNLPRQLVLECEGGFMSEVTDMRPNWDHEIGVLHGANITCISLLVHLRDRVVRDLPLTGVAGEMSLNLRHWMNSLVTIRGQQNRLRQEAFMLDIGGEA